MKLLAYVSDPTLPGGRKVEMMADSSVIKDGRPFFIPMIDGEWDYRLGVAFLVTRMGKTVARRFARRYIGAMTLCVMPRPRVADTAILVGGDMLHSFDGAAIVGSWMDIPSDSLITVSFDGNPVAFDTNPLEAVEPMIELISQFGTLKTGDVMIPVGTLVATNLPENHIATASINDIECLKFKVK